MKALILVSLLFCGNLVASTCVDKVNKEIRAVHNETARSLIVHNVLEAPAASIVTTGQFWVYSGGNPYGALTGAIASAVIIYGMGNGVILLKDFLNVKNMRKLKKIVRHAKKINTNKSSPRRYFRKFHKKYNFYATKNNLPKMGVDELAFKIVEKNKDLSLCPSQYYSQDFTIELIAHN